jgi:voltage-dependent calcium channel R type alpha-1E
VEYANIVFYTIFLVETILKLFGFGVYSFFRDSLNIFDFVIVVLSTGDLVLFIYQHVNTETSSSIDGVLGLI